MDPLHLGACALKPLNFQEILPRKCKQVEKTQQTLNTQNKKRSQNSKNQSLGHYGPDEQLPGHCVRFFWCLFFLVLLFFVFFVFSRLFWFSNLVILFFFGFLEFFWFSSFLFVLCMPEDALLVFAFCLVWEKCSISLQAMAKQLQQQLRIMREWGWKHTVKKSLKTQAVVISPKPKSLKKAYYTTVHKMVSSRKRMGEWENTYFFIPWNPP